MKRLIVISSVLVVAVVWLLPSCSNLPGSKPDAPPRAAIVDQLNVLEPNPELITSATEMLQSAGYQVDVWQGKDVTVDFYRELPRKGYRLILFRVHSGILLSPKGDQMEPSKTTYLFTAETYSTSKYVSGQLADKVSNALMSDKYPLVFAINSRFVAEDFSGNFANTVILTMGCESSYLEDMAVAFVQRGAAAYLGWSTVVSLGYVDNATLVLLRKLCVEKLTVEEGVAKTMAEVGNDPYFNAYLKLYPLSKGKQTIAELAK